MLDKLKTKLETRPFLKSIMVLISGNVLGYAVNLITLPLVSRIYTPAEIGEYDLILSSGRFVIELISLGLLIAIMLPKDDKKAKQLCQLILALNLGSLTILLIVFFCIRESYQLFATSVSYTFSLVLLALYLLVYNMQSLFYSYTNRKKLYRVLFWNPLLLAATNAGISILLGLMGWGTGGYLLGTIFSYTVCVVHMGRYISPFSTEISLTAWKQRLVEYKEIVLVQLPANFISQAGNEISAQYLGRMFGTAILGGYSMATKILNIPVSVLSVPVNRVVYQTMTEKANKGDSVGDFIFEILEKNIKIALLPVGILIITGEKLIPLVLGNSWLGAGEYIAVLGSIYLLKFCSACVSGTFVVMGRQRLSLLMSFVNLAKFGICFGISYVMNATVFHTIAFYAVVECLFQLLNLVLCVYCTDYPVKKFAGFVLKYIVGGNFLIYSVYILFKNFVY